MVEETERLTWSPGRRLGYKLFGSRIAYLLHLRPAEWAIVAAHTLVGFLLAVGVRAAFGPALAPAAWGTFLWVVCLNGGTLAINSAFDNDEGDIAYLRRPPTPPKHLFAFGLALMAAGQVAAFTLPATYRLAYAACFLMSLLYSVPPVRLKAVAGADWFINMWGFGTLTPLAGWAATGVPIGSTGWIILLAFCPLFAALYPLTQLYQIEEDTRRGDRTLAIRLGTGLSLAFSLLGVLVAFGLFAWAGARTGWTLIGPDRFRALGLVVALTAWLAVLLPWLGRYRAMRPSEHQRGMHLALAAWAVTDLAVVVGWGL